jgi:hypothetical protein
MAGEAPLGIHRGWVRVGFLGDFCNQILVTRLTKGVLPGFQKRFGSGTMGIMTAGALPLENRIMDGTAGDIILQIRVTGHAEIFFGVDQQGFPSRNMGIVTAQALAIHGRDMREIHSDRLLDLGMTGEANILELPVDLNASFTNRNLVTNRAFSLEHRRMCVFTLNGLERRRVRVMAVHAVDLVEIELPVPGHFDHFILFVAVQAEEISLLEEKVFMIGCVGDVTPLAVFLRERFVLVSFFQFPREFPVTRRADQFPLAQS